MSANRDLNVNSIPGLVWSADPDGSATFFNRQYVDYVGLTEKHLLGSSWMATVHPDDLEGLMLVWRHLTSARQAGEAEARLRRFDGIYRWFLFRANPVLDESGKITEWLGINIDIDDRKRSEDALRASELHLRQLTETIPEMLWSATPDGKIGYFNGRLLEYLGLKQNEVADGNWWESALHPDDVEPTRRAWQHAAETGEPYEVAVRDLRASDRSYRWCHARGLPLRDEQGKILMWYGSLIDMHDQKIAEEELGASEQRLQLIIDTIPAIVWSAHSDGRADFVNQHFRSYVGLSTEEARDWGWTAAVHPEDRPALLVSWQAVLSSGGPGEFQARLRRFDGDYRWCLFRANPLADFKGNLKWFGACIDMHDWQQAQDELRDTQAELAHVARLMTMGQLTASIAHELNQPLAGILSNASAGLRWLADEPPNVARALAATQRTIRDANRAADVVAGLRALFKKHDTAINPVDLNAATQEVITLTQSELKKARVSLRTELAQGLPAVMGDRIQLQQVVMNLILNALEAMEGVAGRPKELLVTTEYDAEDRVRLTIQDTGVGFDPATAERLFQPFHTTKSHGMGIGLSVSRSIIENHKGHLWAEPNEKFGARFLVAIPAQVNHETF